jgi:transcriptional regulator with XRE-family HTH domain
MLGASSPAPAAEGRPVPRVAQHGGVTHPWWSEVLRHARRRRDVSQRELADLAGVPKSTIGDLETGRIAPSLLTLDRALQAAGYRLEIVDALDNVVAWTTSGVEPRDRAGRRYPPHLDLRLRYPRREGMPASLLFPGTVWTFHRRRDWRDALRLGGRFGAWGCGPPRPAAFDPDYVRQVWGDREVDAFLRDHGWLVGASDT